VARKGAGGAAPDTLDEIEGAAEKMAEWIRTNAVWVVGGIGLTVALAGGVSWLATSTKREEGAAAAELSTAMDEYRIAMGSSPGSFEIPELANPEAAKGIRTEFAERFLAIATEHENTVAGALARLEASDLLAAQGELELAETTLDAALALSVTQGRLRGLVLQRQAQAYERSGRWVDAAASYEAASEIEEFPLRFWALADAGRCLAEAGQGAEALAAFERLEGAAPDFRLPDLHRTLLQELRAAVSAP
jgi:tetratricopeptide (TPR) repeat protein